MSIIPDKTKRPVVMTRPTEPKAKRLFDIPEHNKKQLATLADKKCWKCKGAGYAGWNASGTAVNVCQCVRDRIPAMEAAAEELRARTEAQLAQEKVAAEAAAIAHAKQERRNKIIHYTKVSAIILLVLVVPTAVVFGIIALIKNLLSLW